MDAIVDLCNSDSDESVSLPLLQHHESDGRAPSSRNVWLNPVDINVAEANVKYNNSPGTVNVRVMMMMTAYSIPKVLRL